MNKLNCLESLFRVLATLFFYSLLKISLFRMRKEAVVFTF